MKEEFFGNLEIGQRFQLRGHLVLIFTKMEPCLIDIEGVWIEINCWAFDRVHRTSYWRLVDCEQVLID